MAARMKELFAKYGRVAVAVHLSVSAVSVTGFYVAIQSKVDVGPVLEKIGLISRNEAQNVSDASKPDGPVDGVGETSSRKEGGPAAAASTGGALALAILCNKALFPVRVPLTVALTPPIARFLARRRLYKSV